jgi:hypothetical protein
MNFAIADRRQRDERHVKAVKERPSFDKYKANRTDRDCNGKQGGDKEKSF